MPKRVVIRGRSWSIYSHKDVHSLLSLLGAVGLCYKAKAEIFIDPGQTQAEIDHTLVHELLHACFPQKCCSHNMEEKIVTRLAATMSKMLRDSGLSLVKTGRAKAIKRKGGK